MAKANFTVGVFGIPAKLIDGVVRIKVNVRTDQERQRKAANLPEDSAILLVDCPGGGVNDNDASFDEALEREIREETGGCSLTSLGAFREPLALIKSPVGDLAFWKPIILIGDPKPSNEASDHPWVSRQDLQEGTKYRPVSGLGLSGRTGKMMLAALGWFEDHKDQVDIFS